MQSGYRALVANGFQKNFSVSGTCGGTATLTQSPANQATQFEGKPALAATNTVTMNLSNCSVSSIAGSSTGYYDTNYLPLGSSSDTQYGVVSATPMPSIPSAVKVGDTKIVANSLLYTNSSKATPGGRTENSYVIEADTASTAIVNSISRTYNTANTLTSTEQHRYRMASDGSLTPLSIDIQYSGTSNTHLVLQ